MVTAARNNFGTHHSKAYDYATQPPKRSVDDVVECKPFKRSVQDALARFADLAGGQDPVLALAERQV